MTQRLIGSRLRSRSVSMEPSRSLLEIGVIYDVVALEDGSRLVAR